MQTGDGGGVYIDGSGKIQMKGGTIEKNTVKAGNGGGVYIDVGSEFSMEGNSVVQSNAAENGGGVYVGASSTFNMNGSAQVKENHAGKAGSGACKGGGVFVSYTGKLSMQSESALIKDNWSEGGNGGGVYLDGKFEYKSGKVIGNIANTSDGVKADNVYIPNGRIIDIPDEAAEDEDHEVWVSMQTPGVFTNNAGKLRAPISWFKSDDTNYVVGWYDPIEGNKIELSLSCINHDFVYEADGNTIIGRCTRCGVIIRLITVSEPAHKKYGDEEDANATVVAYFDEEAPTVIYQTWSDGKYGPKTETAPTDAGQHKASITAHGVTAFVEYVVAKAENSLSYRGLTVDRTYSLSGQTAGLRSATKAEGAVSYEIVSQREKSVIFDIIIKAIKWAIEKYLEGQEPEDPEKFAEDVGKEVLEALMGGGGIDAIKDILLE